MKSLGEVKMALWHVKAEISSWKVKLDELLKSIDYGLSSIIGFKHVNKIKQSDGYASKP